ncbi:MAG: hypothetical protein ABEN55_19910 [Bradymonadaceae bacterium]
MSDQDEKDALRRRAIRAAKAVTLGAAVVGSTACGSPDPDDNAGWDVGPDGGSSDDVVADTSQDTAPTCSSTMDGVCPTACNKSNDVDCCKQNDGTWTNGDCAVAVPGPFVPPAMPSART